MARSSGFHFASRSTASAQASFGVAFQGSIEFIELIVSHPHVSLLPWELPHMYLGS